MFFKLHSALMLLIVINTGSIYALPFRKHSIKPPEPCKQHAQDIFFVVDGSRSIEWENFEKVRGFVERFIHSIEVSPETNHVGLLQFSEENRATVEFGFDFKQDKDAILAKLQEVRYHNGRSTFTGVGLKIVVESIFTGTGSDRSDADDILIIFTDGQAHDAKEAKEYAEILKERGVRIITVGAGPHLKRFVHELDHMASGPRDVFTGSFANLSRIVEEIVKDLASETCQEIADPTSVALSYDTQSTPPVNTNIKTSSKTLSAETTKQPTARRPTSEKCHQQSRDIFIVVDGSRSIENVNFKRVKRFLEQFINSVDVSPRGSHVGLLQFSQQNMASVEFGFDSSQEKQDVLANIRGLMYQDGRATYTGQALDVVDSMIFTGTGGDRPDVEDILIVITDGQAHDPGLANAKAQVLKKRGVYILAIAAGYTTASFVGELRKIASDPDEVLSVSFKNLTGIVEYLTGKLCQVKTISPTFAKTARVTMAQKTLPQTSVTTTIQATLMTTARSTSASTTQPMAAKTTISSEKLKTSSETTTTVSTLQTTSEAATVPTTVSMPTITEITKPTIAETTTSRTLLTIKEATTASASLPTTAETTTPPTTPDITTIPTTLLTTAETPTTTTTLLTTSDIPTAKMTNEITTVPTTNPMTAETRTITTKLPETLVTKTVPTTLPTTVDATTAQTLPSTTETTTAPMTSKITTVSTSLSTIVDTTTTTTKLPTIGESTRTLPKTVEITTGQTTLPKIAETRTEIKKLSAIAKGPAIPTLLITTETTRASTPLRTRAEQTTSVERNIPLATHTTSMSLTGTTECSQVARDIFIAVDGTDSVGGLNFAKVRRFLERLARFLDLGPEKTKIGLLEFSSEEKTEVLFSFDSTQNTENFLGKLQDMSYQNGATRSFGFALKTIETSIFTGTGGDRPQVQDLLIVLMSGNSDDAAVASEVSEKLKVKGVRIVAVAVGPTPEEFMDQVELIASSLDDMLTVSFEDLDQIGNFILKNVCGQQWAIPQWTSGNIVIPTTKFPPKTMPRFEPNGRRICNSQKSKDVLFVVDSSENITRTEFVKVKEFLNYAITRMQIRDDTFRIGIMQFSDQDTAVMKKEMSSGVDHAELKKMLEIMLPQTGLKRFTGDAFVEASKKFYEVNTVDARYESPDVIILITNGQAYDQDKVANEVNLLKARNIKIIVIAIGEMRQQVGSQWQAIVNSTYVFTTSTNSLPQLFEEIWAPICSDVYYRKNYPPRYFDCSTRPRDIFFVVDGSASIGYKNFRNVRKLLLDLLILLKRQNADLNIGIMQFSEIDKTKILLKLGRNSLESELGVVQSMVYQSGKKTHTGNALSRVSTEVFNKYGGDRPFVDDILILLTDGNAHDLPLARVMADEMKNRKIRIVGIGAGSDSNVKEFKSELEGMASSKEDVITVDFPDLVSFATKLLQVTCD